MHAHRGRRQKPFREGIRGRLSQVYGDFETAVEDTAVDEVAGSVIAKPRGCGDEAWIDRRQGSDADLGLTGGWLRRALSRQALDQRDRSAQ